MKRPSNIKKRAEYLNKIKPFTRKSLVKVMTGHRRVGKSFILYQLIDLLQEDEKDANIIYINKEDIEFDSIKTYLDLNEYIKKRLNATRMNYIFIDEIQHVAEFYKTVSSLALDELNDIYITGSNAEILSSDLANNLGGRYVEFKIYSLSYPEFLEFHNLKDDDTVLEKYAHFGGLPYLIHLPMNEPVVMEYLRSIYSTIVLKDVVQKRNIRNSLVLEQLIQFLASTTGNLFSSKSISDFLKQQQTDLSPNQVSEYADALVAAFVLHRVKRYDVVGKRFFERGEKYYFENMGIRNVVAGYKPQDKARRLENLVCNHLLFKGYDIHIGNVGADEIDFVCTRNGETLYIQVAYELSREETIEREFGNLLKIKDNYPKLVITNERSHETSYNGVKHMHIRDFLIA